MGKWRWHFPHSRAFSPVSGLWGVTMPLADLPLGSTFPRVNFCPFGQDISGVTLARGPFDPDRNFKPWFYVKDHVHQTVTVFVGRPTFEKWSSDSLAVCKKHHTVPTQVNFPAFKGSKDSHHLKLWDYGTLPFGRHGFYDLFLNLNTEEGQIFSQHVHDQSPETAAGGCVKRGIDIYVQYFWLGCTYPSGSVMLEKLGYLQERPKSRQTEVCPWVFLLRPLWAVWRLWFHLYFWPTLLPCLPCWTQSTAFLQIASGPIGHQEPGTESQSLRACAWISSSPGGRIQRLHRSQHVWKRQHRSQHVWVHSVEPGNKVIEVCRPHQFEQRPFI